MAMITQVERRVDRLEYLLPSKEQIREVLVACISTPPAHKWAGYTCGSSLHKWGFNTCFLSPIYAPHPTLAWGSKRGGGAVL